MAAAGRGSPISEEQLERFHRLTEILDLETMFYSDFRTRAEHWANLEIIAMGEVVVPLLLADMERDNTHWFSTMRAITGANPRPRGEGGNIVQMVNRSLA